MLQFYAAWLRRIEMGLNSWGDDLTQIEPAMLTGQSLKKKKKHTIKAIYSKV